MKILSKLKDFLKSKKFKELERVNEELSMDIVELQNSLKKKHSQLIKQFFK